MFGHNTHIMSHNNIRIPIRIEIIMSSLYHAHTRTYTYDNRHTYDIYKTTDKAVTQVFKNFLTYNTPIHYWTKHSLLKQGIHTFCQVFIHFSISQLNYYGTVHILKTFKLLKWPRWWRHIKNCLVFSQHPHILLVFNLYDVGRILLKCDMYAAIREV
jgi:hypothetical protein